MLPFDPKKPFYGFTMRFPHAKRRLQFFVEEAETETLVYFRPKYAPSDWWGILGDGWIGFDALEIRNKEASPFSFLRQTRRFLLRQTFFRQFYLPDPREGEKRIWSVHWRPDIGRIYPVQQENSLRHAYFTPQDNTPCNLARIPTQSIKDQFSREWHDPTSDAREALEFCDLNFDERARRVLCWETGSIEQVEHLVRVACASEPMLWERSQSGHILIDPTEDCPLYVHPIFYERGQFQQMLSPRLHRVLQLICDTNRAFAQIGKNDRIWAGSPWEPNLPEDMLEAPNIYIQLQSTTQHEHMEAGLFLRDWLRENAPDLLPEWFPDAV